VQGYCEALRAELATSGISVHVASPGYIRTNLSKSALTGDGRLYNKMDDATAAGADPNDVAIDILQKSAAGRADFVTAITMSARIAILLKFCAPALLQKLLRKRYEKSQK
jgi:dehydrogenase/reductase SDR family member 7B